MSSSTQTRHEYLWIWFLLTVIVSATLTSFFMTNSGFTLYQCFLLNVVFSSGFPIIAHAYQRFQAIEDHSREIDQLNRRAQMMGRPSSPRTAAQVQIQFSSWAYTLCLIPTVIISFVGWAFVFGSMELNLSTAEPKASSVTLFKTLSPLVLKAMAFGFLGALVFCIQLLFRRFTAKDLNPSIFLRCTVSMFCGLVFSFVVFTAAGSFEFGISGENTSDWTGSGALIGSIVAFSLGYFPNMAIRWFTRIANQSLGEESRRSDGQRLLLLDGVGLFHEERLSEAGIHNLHDLAFADHGRVWVNTPYSAQQIMDWIDQSLLFMFLDNKEMASFRRGGIRNASDFVSIWSDPYSHQNMPQSETEQRTRIATMFQTSASRLDCIYVSIVDERKRSQGHQPPHQTPEDDAAEP